MRLARRGRTQQFGTLACLTLQVACAPMSRRGLGPIVTDRPDYTDGTEIVARGTVQVETGGTFTRAPDEASATVGEVMLRVAASSRAEARIGLNSYAFSRAGGRIVHGFDHMSLGTKIKLVSGGGEGSIVPAVAVLITSSLPTATPRMSTRRVQPEAKLAAAWIVTSRVSFSSNLNRSVIRESGGRYTEWGASGSLGVEMARRLSSYVEYYTTMPRSTRIRSSRYLDSGLLFALTDDLQLDLRAGVGLRHVAGPDYFLGSGVSRRW